MEIRFFGLQKTTTRHITAGLAVVLRRSSLGLLLTLTTPSRLALAHEGEPLAPHDLWSSWNWDPIILLGLVLTGWIYGRGVHALWQQAGRGRGISTRQAVAFSAGLAALFVALISPLDTLAGVLFSAHMIQHILLILGAAPLLVLGAPPVALAWSVPGGWRRDLSHWWHAHSGLRSTWHMLSLPIVVWFAHAATLWVWHAPGLYQSALRSESIHALEHASFLITALLFWWVFIHSRSSHNLNLGTGVLYVFTTALHSGLLGALITFSPQPWYPKYAATTGFWNLTPLVDQQLAGAIMWVPAGVIYLGAALLLLCSSLQAMEREDAL